MTFRHLTLLILLFYLPYCSVSMLLVCIYVICVGIPIEMSQFQAGAQ